MKYIYSLWILSCAMNLVFSTQLCAKSRHHQTVAGTWYLALDTSPYGLTGLALSGLATIHSDGTFVLIDAGDFGQASFLGTQHSPQLGSWRYVNRVGKHGSKTGEIIATSLFLEADLDGEIQNWYRVTLSLKLSEDGQAMAGFVNVSVLECMDVSGVPSPLACLDPIANADLFEPDPVPNVPVTFSRLNP